MTMLPPGLCYSQKDLKRAIHYHNEGLTMTDQETPTPNPLYKALAEFQDACPAIAKASTADVGKYSYSYADLPTIMEAIKPHLKKAKLVITQGFAAGSYGPNQPKQAQLVTALCHWPSGQEIKSSFPFEVNVDPQVTGKLMTYYRRYTLSAILGLVTEEDDDATSASPQAQQRAAPKARSAGKTTTTTSAPTARSSTEARPSKQCPVCGKGKAGGEGPDYPLLQDRKDPNRWFHWNKKGEPKVSGCGWTGNPDEYVATNRIKEGEANLERAAAELQAQKDAEDEAEHGL